ncbi:uncharacterized protein LOC120016529 isoform X4 [Tripterygium wilfordii]|uniref:uncharacterized protein LOC120016529 isoform X4 n=1 Tax=Tripterygium wilfordii TaxID=458696 RepID=UPI0018F7F897|nr:uncharacterized protein LOC120016529 isoform X4 [Tripterygium wilfordii]
MSFCCRLNEEHDGYFSPFLHITIIGTARLRLAPIDVVNMGRDLVATCYMNWASLFQVFCRSVYGILIGLIKFVQEQPLRGL